MKTSFEIRVASRELARQFYTAAGNSFLKTITEPVTNSDSSYKRMHVLPDACGVIAHALEYEKGQHFDLSSWKKERKGKTTHRRIDIHIYSAKWSGHKSRTCELVDHAEGLSPDEVKAAFEQLAADKSEVSKGRPGRSLFGRGVSDVLFAHNDGCVYSYKNGVLTEASFSFDRTKDDRPRCDLYIRKRVSSSKLKSLHLLPGENGTCVTFQLNNDCHIPEEGTIVQALSQFYMLRLINYDPDVSVRVYRYRANHKAYDDVLEYDFPTGDVIDRFKVSIGTPVENVSLPPLIMEGI